MGNLTTHEIGGFVALGLLAVVLLVLLLRSTARYHQRPKDRINVPAGAVGAYSALRLCGSHTFSGEYDLSLVTHREIHRVGNYANVVRLLVQCLGPFDVAARLQHDLRVKQNIDKLSFVPSWCHRADHAVLV